MGQAQTELCLAFQAVERSAIVKQRVREYLEGDQTLEVSILCEPNDAHPATANNFLESVAAKDSLSGPKPWNLNSRPQIQIIWLTVALHEVLLIGSVNHFNCFLQHHWRTGLSERAEERTSGRFHLTIANRPWSIRADLHAELQFLVVSSGLPRLIRRGALPFTGLALRFGFGASLPRSDDALARKNSSKIPPSDTALQ